MTTGDLIDRILQFTDNVDAADPANDQRRLRHLQYCQEVFDDVWHYRPWLFKMRVLDPLTIPDGAGEVVLPLDFEALGPNGGVFHKDNMRRIREIDYRDLITKKRLNLQAGNPPEVFAIGGLDTTTGQDMINILHNSGDVVLLMHYEAAPVTLVDNDIGDGSDGLWQIPARYHRSVLLQGVHARVAKSQGDTRDWYSAYQRGLAYMIAREQKLTSEVQQFPRAVIGMH